MSNQPSDGPVYGEFPWQFNDPPIDEWDFSRGYSWQGWSGVPSCPQVSTRAPSPVVPPRVTPPPGNDLVGDLRATFPKRYCRTVRQIREQFHSDPKPPAVTSLAAVVDNDDDYPSSLDGDESLVPEANAEDETLSGSEDEVDPDDDFSAQAWKSPAVPWVGPVGAGKGKRPSSVGVAFADVAEWQEDEEDEEEEDDDDDDEYAPVRPSRRATGGKHPPRISTAPAPTISSRKASSWSDAEDQACIKFMKEICTLKQYAGISGTEKRFEVVAERMKRNHGFDRTASGVKLQWNRRLRAASGFEDRGEKKHSGSGLTTSSLVKGTKRGTLAATSLVANSPANGTNVSASPDQSTETEDFSRASIRRGKRKARFIESDDEDDGEGDLNPRPRSFKRARSSSVVPSTQDLAYYDISNENIITTPRSSRQKRAITIEASDNERATSRPSRKQLLTTTTAPARSSRPKRVSTIDDDEDGQDIAAYRTTARSNRQKRIITDSDYEDEGQASSAPEPKRRKMMSDFSKTLKYSRKDNRLLERSDADWWVSSRHYVRLAHVPAPEQTVTEQPTIEASASDPARNSKAYWQNLLRDRQNAVAKLRESAERSNVEDDSEDDEPIITTADKAKRSRELRRQKTASTATTSSAQRFSPQLPAITEQAENSVDEDNDDADDDDDDTAEYQDDATAAQLAADEELARQLQAELNGGFARHRRGRGFN